MNIKTHTKSRRSGTQGASWGLQRQEREVTLRLGSLGVSIPAAVGGRGLSAAAGGLAPCAHFRGK